MTSRLEFLSASQAKKRSIPWPDVYFTPGYGRAAEESDGYEWEVAIWETGPIVFPYLMRTVSPELSGREDLYDIASPYGYSGTWAPSELPRDEWVAFRRELRRQLKDRGVVAEFHRYSELVPGRKEVLGADSKLRGFHHNDTVLIDVAQDYDACWNQAEGRSRTKTRKARKKGYQWTSHPAEVTDISSGSVFRKLYEATMRRVGADEYYFFPGTYYTALLDSLGPNLRVVHVANENGQIGIAGLFMLFGHFIHLHLSGSEPWATKDGAGNMLYDGLIQWGCEREDYRFLHIGGGMEKDDGIFRFKRGFGGSRISFWIAHSVIDKAKYLELVGAHAKRSGRSSEELEATQHFPAYRA